MAVRRFAALLSCSAALVASQLAEPAPAAVHAFVPTADATVSARNPNRYFGASENLRVKAGRPTNHVYARFNVAGLAGPVTRARLRFFVTDGTRNGPAVYLTGPWSSSRITWNRRPAATNGPRGDKGRLVRGRWAEWDVTPWVTGDGAYGFALRDGSADAVTFAARETKRAGKKPRLIVTTSTPNPDPDPNPPPPPPPPATIEYVSPTNGQTVSGTSSVQVRAPAGTEWIGVWACGGESVGEDHVIGSNGVWSVQWDTRMTACSNGPQDLDTWAFRDDGSSLANRSIVVTVNNTAPPPPPPPPPPVCAPSSAPGPIDGQGYSLRFSDCFDTLSRSVWCSNQWWEPRPPADTQYAESGVLHIVRRRSDGYPNVTVSSEPCGQSSPKSFRQGYFEARMRWTGVPGSGPAFWLLSTAHATNPNWPQPACPQPTCLSAEIDVFEGYGNHLNVFTGSIHRNSCNCYGEPSQMNSNNWQPLPGVNMSNWHVLAALWTSTDVTWYVDGDRIMSAPVFDSTNQPMHLLFYNWRTPWEPGNGTSASTPNELHTEVDWVRVWQR